MGIRLDMEITYLNETAKYKLHNPDFLTNRDEKFKAWPDWPEKNNLCT